MKGMFIHYLIEVRWSLCLFVLYLLITPYDAAQAHGGVSFEKDVCVLQIGNYRMHFTGYLPKANRSEEFCEDIPGTGQAFIVFDMIDEALRDMQIEIRLLEDTGTKGVNTTYADLGSRTDIEQNTIVSLPYVRYPRGTVVIEHMFLESGKYIGMVEVQVPGKNEPIVSVFPFSVGVSSIWEYWPYALALGVIVVAGFVIRSFWR